MHARDRASWFAIPALAVGVAFVVVWIITLLIRVLGQPTDETFAGSIALFYAVMVATGIGAVTGMFSLAIGFGARRRDFVLGTVAMGAAVSAAWAVVLTLLSIIEARVIKNWLVGVHFFHLPFFSGGTPLREFCWTTDAVCAQVDPIYEQGGAPLQQVWSIFAFLLFLLLLGVMFGSVYQRFGRNGIYIALGAVILLLSLVVVMSSVWRWWGAIFGWLGQQTVASLAWWMAPPAVLFALASYALLRKATV